VSDAVYVRHGGMYCIATAKFYYQDVSSKIRIDRTLADENFPGWDKKPIYLVMVYSPEELSGQKFIAFYDILTLTSELN
jgi:hypothetical protein